MVTNKMQKKTVWVFATSDAEANERASGGYANQSWPSKEAALADEERFPGPGEELYEVDVTITREFVCRRVGP